MTLSETRINTLLDAMAGRRIAVVGDVMLDRYFRGSVARISPEAPVPVVDVAEESEHPGGAANVAYNLRTLGATPVLIGVVGQDRAGEHLAALLDGLGIGAGSLVVDSTRPTTVKTRVIAASQHICRIDHEERRAMDSGVLDRLVEAVAVQLPTLDGLILQDYNKGVVAATLIPRVVEAARAAGVPVYTDPKYANFFEYRNVSVFKPNRKEAEDALKRELHDEGERRSGAMELMDRLACDSVVLTLGPDGMMLAEREAEPVLIPTRARHVADVSGAGDTVIATLAASRAAGATMYEAVVAANHAAGIVCGEVGTVPVERESLRAALAADLIEGETRSER